MEGWRQRQSGQRENLVYEKRQKKKLLQNKFCLTRTGLLMEGSCSACHSPTLGVDSQRAGTLEVLMTTSTRPVMLLCLAALSAVATAFLQFVLYFAVGLCVFLCRFT
jgi:hypothetical protein